jgi:hypothetical protein
MGEGLYSSTSHREKFLDHRSGFEDAIGSARAVVARRRHEPPDQIALPFPAAKDDVKGLACVGAAAKISALRIGQGAVNQRSAMLKPFFRRSHGSSAESAQVLNNSFTPRQTKSSL